MNLAASFVPPNLSDFLSVYAGDAVALEQAERFAKALQLPLFSYQQTSLKHVDAPYVFQFEGARAQIVQTGKSAPGPVTASFLQGKTAHRLKFGGGKGQMIAKAVGLNKGVKPSILDATAGLAQDAFVLASLGCQMTLLERSPIIAQLVASALLEARGTDIDDIISRMTLLSVNACDWLSAQSEKVADVIYLDPMYPHNDKSALVKKEMRLFHTLVGQTEDDAKLLALALEKARYRVVVKRPRKGVTIVGQQPAHQILGKSCRYDIYPLQRLENLK
ncbi:MAG: class I SAM-dependent methyltransferase [Oleiphilus sp.]